MSDDTITIDVDPQTFQPIAPPTLPEYRELLAFMCEHAAASFSIPAHLIQSPNPQP